MSSSLMYPKCALVTGALGGIGKAILERFRQCNTKIIAVDMVAKAYTDEGAGISYYQCDISNSNQIIDVWRDIAKLGITVDCLVNNAGIYKALSWQDYDHSQIMQVLQTNLIGAFNMACNFAKQATNGSIINISSVAALSGGSDPIYSASKAGMIGMTKSLAITLAPTIRVNAIAPAVVCTPMMDIIPPAVLAKYKHKELLTQELTPESISDTVLFLASSGAQNITGSTIDVNNGVYLR